MRTFYALILSLLLLSCLSESNVDPGSSATFIRFFNGGNNDEAKGLEVTPDGGFMILATTKIQKSEADIARYKVKLIKTDAAGNPLWQRLYPDFSDTNRDYIASSIQPRPGGGYIIVGDVIQTDSVSKSLVMTVDEDGTIQGTLDLYFSLNVPQKGKAVAVDANGNYVVLSTQGSQTLIFTQVDKTTLQPVLPQRSHAAGETALANKLLIDPAGKAVASGMKTVSGLTGIRLLRTIPNSPVTDFDLLLSEPGYSLAGYDFCRYGLGYAIAGATNLKPDGSAATDTDIMFFLTDADGNRIRLTTFSFDDPATPENEDQQIDAGNAIAPTLDGGLIFLSSINSAAIAGRGDTEFYLIKINAFGEKEWSSSFGSRFKDEGVAIRQLSDGSYIALGTTTQGALKILTLFKTSSNGKIE
ncbi:MAG: hypothetical protein JNN04_07540 [Cyclobacteriaceae bacterium]|nr:hypothetical protein [Cyclobacteriaceae bacterium]